MGMYASTMGGALAADVTAGAPKSVTPIGPNERTETASALQSPPDQLARNTIYVEGLGPGLLWSINYERIVTEDLGVRIGFGYLSMGASASTSEATVSASSSMIFIPMTASYLGIRSGKHALELGAGVTIISVGGSVSGFGVNASASGIVPVGDLIVGYRVHPVDGAGFNFRIGMGALVGTGLGFSATDPTAIGALPWPYLSLGGSF